ncbi:hypothetical protein [Cerasicoccus arenae]|uniref:PEP-CTERM sorting domain-containing protein n=1 Tax=Cerasicoccus arenae TaxID=424488 RepID=A0A8J3DCI8_9BACT|nr:hypothetical protein [Cerasicoccus arenae]MBK1857600.1 hypothetical protein [Cerasicoccus arenae]GHC05652.1 hypothetical protein GCM10007047_23250 [Cerasicoccus arenae]
MSTFIGLSVRVFCQYSYIGAFALLTSPAAHAVSLVYEGFNYGGSTIPINGVAVGGGATGLSGSYATVTGTSGNDNVQSSNYVPTGLTFSNLATTGGSLFQSVQPKIDNVKEYAYTHIPLSTTATGDIYQTMLVNVSASALVNPTLGQDPSNSGVSELRLQDTSNLTGNASGSMAEAVKRASQTGIKSGSQYIVNGPISGSQAISLNQNYLMVNSFSNVGLAGGGTANTWMFDEVSFDNWQSNGGLEVDLDTYALFSTSNSSSSTIVFDSTKSMRISTSEFSIDFNSGATSYDNIGELTVTYDEVRYGTTLGDVVVVPEPSAYALAVGCIVLAVIVRRRRLSR